MAPSTSPYGGGIANWTNKILGIGLGTEWEFILVDEKPTIKKDFNRRSFFDLFKEIPRTLRIYRDLHIALRDKSAEIVHIAIPSYFLSMLRECYSVRMAKRKKRKVVLHFRSTLPNTIKTPRTLRIFKRLVKRVDHVLLLNKESETFFKKHSKVSTSVIPNFIDNAVLNLDPITVKSDVKRVIYTGMITKEKGAVEFIEVAKFHPEIEFALMGTVSAEINKDNVSTNVKFIPKANNEKVIEELRQSDVFVFPTYFPGEGFSNSLLEAMAVGLPCIATDWAANKDMLENKGGEIISRGSAEELNKAIIKLANNFALRQQYSLWNQSKVKLYAQDVVIDQYVEVYKLLLK